jgi:hypothetical protein
VSLVLCLAGIVFGVRGFFYADSADWRDGWQVFSTGGRMEYHSRQTIVWSSVGEFRFNTQHDFSIRAPAKIVDPGPGAQLFLRSGPADWVPPSNQAKYLINRWGFRVGEIKQSWLWGWEHAWGIAVPAWSWVLFFGLLPAGRGMMALRRTRRKEENLCRKCGYDLRATKERCPECGTGVETLSRV